MNKKAQGAIEYLLLLAAAIIVVGIVVTFMIGAIDPIEDSGSRETYEYICNTLDSNTESCGCYLGYGDEKGYFPDETTGTTTCCAKTDSLLKEQWTCTP